MKRYVYAAALIIGASAFLTGCAQKTATSSETSSAETSTSSEVTPTAKATATPKPTSTPTPTVTPVASSAETVPEESKAVSDDEMAESDAEENSVEPANGSSDYASQLQVLADNYDVWSTSDMGTLYGWCAVTDLDNNGRLEVIPTMIYGNSNYTYATICEVNETMNGINKVSVSGVNEYNLPDFLASSSVPMYENSNGRYYIFTNTERNGAANHYYSLDPTVLTDGTLYVEVLGTECDVEDSTYYTDGSGNEITADNFNSLVDKKFSYYTEHEVSICWVELSEGTDVLTQLTTSWNGFIVD